MPSTSRLVCPDWRPAARGALVTKSLRIAAASLTRPVCTGVPSPDGRVGACGLRPGDHCELARHSHASSLGPASRRLSQTDLPGAHRVGCRRRRRRASESLSQAGLLLRHGVIARDRLRSHETCVDHRSGLPRQPAHDGLSRLPGVGGVAHRFCGSSRRSAAETSLASRRSGCCCSVTIGGRQSSAHRVLTGSEP